MTNHTCSPLTTRLARRFLALGAVVSIAGSAVAAAPSAGAADACDGVTNPTTGACLHVEVFTPSSGADTTVAVVMAPGGRSDSTLFTGNGDAQRIADGGYTVVVFDPDGRGESTGTEDDNGHAGQDGLEAVVEYTAAIDGIETVGMISNSYGVTLATGVLARYEDSPAAFLIDWEGPANRDDTGGCDGVSTRGHLYGNDCTDESFWGEREADTFAALIDVPYLRLQSVTDHVQPDYQHTLAMVNAAVSSDSPWVGLNRNEITRSVSSINTRGLISDRAERPASNMYVSALELILAHV